MIDENQETLEAAAAIVLAGAATRGLRIATAENYTGGLIAALLSSVDTRARWFERGVVVATEAAQRDLLGVPQALIDQCGPVSRPVALAMAEGARLRSAADAGLAVTGYPSPVGDGEEAGLVFVAACSGERAECRELHLGPLDSVALRDHAALAALSVLAGIVKDYPAAPRPGTIVEILPS